MTYPFGASPTIGKAADAAEELAGATVRSMRCPSCEDDDTRVVDSRAAEDGDVTRRRRQCSSCHFRFTTFERVEEAPIVVIKRSGDRQPFDPNQIVRGLRMAAKGRPLSEERFCSLAAEVEDEMRTASGEITSERVGLAVLNRLRLIDKIAALRFASVYKGFTEVADFERELRLIKP